MTIKTIYFEDKENYGERARYQIIVDGDTVVSAGTSEPEDANLGRDFSFVFDIVPLMEKAREAGLRGEELVIENIKQETDDY